MLTQRQALEEARRNIACGTSIAARIKETSQNPEIRELAKAIHFIGFGSQQVVNAFTDSGYLSTQSPTTKKVVFTLYFARMSIKCWVSSLPHGDGKVRQFADATAHHISASRKS